MGFVKNFLLGFITLLFVGKFLSSCNELPSEITYSLLYDTTIVLPVTSDSVDFFGGLQTKYVPARIFNTGSIFVGGWNGYRTASLLRFKESNLPDTLLWLTEDRIEKVELVLPFQNYLLGDSLNTNFSFKVFLINQYWTNKVTWDSIFNDWTPKPLIEQMPIGSFSGKIQLKDTINEISIQLQKSFVLDWLSKNKDSIPIWGLLIAPDPSCNIIHQIGAQYITESKVSHPKLVVYYKNQAGGNRIWYINSAIDASVVDVPKVDTLNSFVIQSGFSYRFSIEFDLSKLPKFSAIHFAQLELTIDPKNTFFGNTGLDSVFTGGYFGDNPLDSVPLISFLGSRQGEKVIFHKVSTPIELWLKENGKGELIFYSYYWNEVRTLNRIAFYGLNAPDPRKRPKLKLIYSKRLLQ